MAQWRRGPHWTERSKSQSPSRYPNGSARQMESGKKALRDMESSKDRIYFPSSQLQVVFVKLLKSKTLKEQATVML